MQLTRFTTEQRIGHLLGWANEWNGTTRGRSMWAYSLSLGGSHALLNDWVNNERLMNRLTPEERSVVEEARRRATRRETATNSPDRVTR